MTATYFTADLHFGHKNIMDHSANSRLDQSGQPFRDIKVHDDFLIEKWNSVVHPHDIIYVLGDLAWNTDAGRYALNNLNGTIYLILGDHDPKWDWLSCLNEGLLSGIYGDLKWKSGVLLSHVPSHVGGKYKVNVHGHTHERLLNGHTEPRTHCCVSIEQTWPCPISWNQLKNRKTWNEKKIRKGFDA